MSDEEVGETVRQIVALYDAIMNAARSSSVTRK